MASVTFEPIRGGWAHCTHFRMLNTRTLHWPSFMNYCSGVLLLRRWFTCESNIFHRCANYSMLTTTALSLPQPYICLTDKLLHCTTGEACHWGKDNRACPRRHRPVGDLDLPHEVHVIHLHERFKQIRHVFPTGIVCIPACFPVLKKDTAKMSFWIDQQVVNLILIFFFFVRRNLSPIPSCIFQNHSFLAGSFFALRRFYYPCHSLMPCLTIYSFPAFPPHHSFTLKSPITTVYLSFEG